MLNIIELIKDEGRAEGKSETKAESKAEGLVDSLITLVQAGDLPRDRALLRLRHLAEQGLISAAQCEAAVQRLS